MRGSRPATYALRLRERKPATFAGTKVGGGGLARPEGPRVRAGASIVRPGFISQMGEGVSTRSDGLVGIASAKWRQRVSYLWPKAIFCAIPRTSATRCPRAPRCRSTSSSSSSRSRAESPCAPAGVRPVPMQPRQRRPVHAAARRMTDATARAHLRIGAAAWPGASRDRRCRWSALNGGSTVNADRGCAFRNVANAKNRYHA
jgi:hypothetical protein